MNGFKFRFGGLKEVEEVAFGDDQGSISYIFFIWAY
jgi:hypothetical protein